MKSRRLSDSQVDVSSIDKQMNSQMTLDTQSIHQLAAISNYKLAQLTFAPPSFNSLLKTALIKNTVNWVYDVSAAALKDIPRWTFFTPESICKKTEGDLEQVIAMYVKTFRTLGTDSLKNNALPERTSSKQDKRNNLQIKVQNPDYRLYKPLPPCPGDENQHSRSPAHKRMSWTSDAGSSNGAVQHLATELMSLFDMDFCVDIALNSTTGTRPRPPSGPRRLRPSSLSGSRPTNPEGNESPKKMTFPPPPSTRPPPGSTLDSIVPTSSLSTPTRSSSLHHSKLNANSQGQNKRSLLKPLLRNGSTRDRMVKPLRKLSIHRLAFKSKSGDDSEKNVPSVQSNSEEKDKHDKHVPLEKTRSVVSVASTSTTVSASQEVIMVATKTAPFSSIREQGSPVVPKESNSSGRQPGLVAVRPIVVDVAELKRTRSLGRRTLDKKDDTLPANKGVDIPPASPTPDPQAIHRPSRSNSSLHRIGTTIRAHTNLRRTLSNIDLRKKNSNAALNPSTNTATKSTKTSVAESSTDSIPLAKKLVNSLGRRMKLQRT